MTAPTKRRADAADDEGGRRRRVAWAASRAGVDLPVRVRAWDGSEAGPPGAPVAVLRSPLALRRALWAPGELGLARAYVSGDLDVDGDLTEGLRRAFRAARSAQSGRASGGGGGRRGRPRRVAGSGAGARAGRAGREPGARLAGPGRWADVVSASAVAASRSGYSARRPRRLPVRSGSPAGCTAGPGTGP